METILKVENLTKVFSRKGQPDFTAVNHIGFEMGPGECLGLIGESGSGKSTTVNMITRLLDVTEGSIVLDGMDITNVSGRELRRVYAGMQMVFQTPTDSFDPRRTLGDGQCQRAAIARALAIRPKLLICDEATSALDVTIQQEIIALLSDLRWTKGTDLSILFICHDIALVQQFCSRVLVMYKGDIVEQGDPNVIIRNPKDPYTKRLIDSIL